MVGYQFRQYAGQNVGYQNGYNAVQNVGNQVVQDAVQNQGVQNVGTQNGQIVVPGIINQNPNGNGMLKKQESNCHAGRVCFDGAAADIDEIEEVNANCILMANLQQASTSGTSVMTIAFPSMTRRISEVHNMDNCYDNEIFNMFTQEEQYTETISKPFMTPTPSTTD
ncbi:hypothetical protein Tco_0537469 [Tanacetum coccineum]